MKKNVLAILLISTLVSCNNINHSDSSISNENTSVLESLSSIIESSSNEQVIVATQLDRLSEETFVKLNENEDPYKLFLNVYYSDDSSKLIELDESMIEGNIDFYTVGNYSFTVNYEGLTNNYTISVVLPKTISLSGSTSCSGIDKYSTGSFGSFSDSSVGMDFYRAYRNKTDNDFTSLLAYNDNINEGSVPGSIYNTTPAYQIKSVEIEYKSEGGICLSTGKTRKDMSPLVLPGSKEYTTYKTNIDNDNFFSIETISTHAYIKNINIVFTGVQQDYDSSYDSCGNNQYRINPFTYTDAKVPGQSYIDLPIDITVDDNKYIINETKRYTYYTYDYVSSNPEIAESASYVTPTDVANYFIAFGTYPANYVVKKSYNNAYKIFKNNTRCVSDYNRTTGYANYVPYRANSSGKPHYYECDIALDSTYSSSNRGIGRVVVWEYGFNYTGYDASMVAVYTDDHYATFQEYLNTGEWGTRFNAEMQRTSFVWGSAKTLAPAN